jgi:hypothetical protein
MDLENAVFAKMEQGQPNQERSTKTQSVLPPQVLMEPPVQIHTFMISTGIATGPGGLFNPNF